MITHSEHEFYISVYYEKRPDGGVRISSVDVPGFVLSHHNAELVFKDVEPALEVILSEMLGKSVRVRLPRKVKTSGAPEIQDSGTLNYVAMAA